MTPSSGGTAERVATAIAARITPVSLALIAAYVIALALMIATSHGGLDAAGRPLGTDFSNVWSAGRLVLEGAPQAAYDVARHHGEQQREFGAAVPFYGWHYPPMFLGLAALLATLPYVSALFVWQAATLPLYLWSLVRIVGAHRREVLLVGLAFPAVFVNLTHGHNGFLTAALFGCGLYILDRRPLLAGVLLGLLAYKPQFGLLLPLVLIATGRWRTAGSAALTVAAIAAASWVAFGAETWEAFRASAAFTRSVVLEQGDTGWHKIMSAFSAARALGAGVGTAYAIHAAVAVAALVITLRVWRGEAAFGAKAATLLAGSLLMTPYLLDYDLMLFAPAVAFLAHDALRDGWRPHEPVLLAVIFLAPLVARPLAEITLIPIGLFATLALFACAVARARPDTAPDRTLAYAAHR
ncbi:DUF2029 domain-containing protein [Chelatococcus sambhunathii]|uniref:DUF2029 domain-containing protein n=1 Tax=Chelatococcus sambhunathii TaxID=363953 RepID=A0ABU1DBV3_9HYPH|nr:glycosyltransferase family 87 protein [Chelatococcus sambhunathii]MDR4305594.1 DUF2029 domain-containing protein [Chelatococcus sambhunathii]